MRRKQILQEAGKPTPKKPEKEVKEPPKVPDNIPMHAITATAARQARQHNISPRVLVFDEQANKSAIKTTQEPKKLLLGSENKIPSIPETSSPTSPVKEESKPPQETSKTGAIQKKKNYQSQHSHSLKYSGSGSGELFKTVQKF
jgi:hypothetical protein